MLEAQQLLGPLRRRREIFDINVHVVYRIKHHFSAKKESLPQDLYACTLLRTSG
ncbi:hypothetical protein [Rosenbergiella metrosideri]|uniref:hypothetical protein n=1 Tax=Rosenbergiella metrosideri TaxID=2921185 RepID=UPI001F4F32E2|nr:hypothetical protein [Rosenbergiella metrosideri]